MLNREGERYNHPFENLAQEHFTIQELPTEEVPKEVISCDHKKGAVQPPRYSLQGTYEIAHSNGDKTYVFRRNSPFFTEKTFVYDIDPEGKMLGEGQFGLDTFPLSKDTPSVKWTENTFLGRGKSLGRRRLLIMDSLSRLFYNHPLSSDTIIISTDAKRVWEGLVDEGKVRKFSHHGKDRFRFNIK